MPENHPGHMKFIFLAEQNAITVRNLVLCQKLSTRAKTDGHRQRDDDWSEPALGHSHLHAHTDRGMLIGQSQPWDTPTSRHT